MAIYKKDNLTVDEQTVGYKTPEDWANQGFSRINSDNLQQQQPINYETPQYPQVPYLEPLQGIPQYQMTQPEQQAQDLNDYLQQLNMDLTGEATYRYDQENQQKLPKMYQTQQDLTNRYNALVNEAQALPIQMQQMVEGKGVTAGGLQPLQASALRKNAIQALTTQSLLQASQGNIATAQTLVDRAVAAKYDPIRAEIDAATKNLDLIIKSPAYTLADKNRAEAQKAIQEARAAAIAKQEEDQKQIYQTALDAAKFGADAETLRQIQNAKTPGEALALASPYLGREYEDKMAQQEFENYIKAGTLDLQEQELAQKIQQMAFDQKMDLSEFQLKRAMFSTDTEFKNAQLVLDKIKLESDLAGEWDLKFDDSGNMVKFNPKTGEIQTFGTSLPAEGSYGGQCGDYLNKILDNKPAMGNTIQSKMSKINVPKDQLIQNPQPGDILVISTGRPEGHVAVVTAVNDDGTVEVNESNWGLDEKVGTRTVNLNDANVMGAYRGASFKGAGDNLGAESWATLIQRGEANITNVPDDLKTKVATITATTPSNKDTQSQEVAKEKLGLLQDVLSNTSGLNASTGPNPLARSGILNPISSYLSGSRQNFIAGVMQLVSQETLNTLLELKKGGGTLGALSDQERLMLQNAATKVGSWSVPDKNGKVVGFNTTESSMKQELSKIYATTYSALLNSQGQDAEAHPDGTVWVANKDGSMTRVYPE